jgi:hypothetical protein
MFEFGWLRVRATKVVAAQLAATLVGYAVGWATFRMPSFACGPFNSDRFALWLAGGGGCAAAIATFLAAKIALDTGQRAIESEQNFRNEDRQEANRERTRRQSALATVFIAPLYTICLNSAAWQLMLHEDDVDVYDISKLIREIRTDVVDALISNIIEFDSTAVATFGLTYSKLKAIIAAAHTISSDNQWDDIRLHQQKTLLANTVKDLSNDAYTAWRIFLTIAVNVEAVDDPRNTAQEYTTAYVEELRAQKLRKS